MKEHQRHYMDFSNTDINDYLLSELKNNLDVEYIRTHFGTKYDVGIEQMIAYASVISDQFC